MLAPRLPISIDPLIAEAKRRTFRRRFVFGVVALLLVALGVAFELHHSGGSPGRRVTILRDSSNPLSHLKVPLDRTERHWRSMLPALEGKTASPSAIAAVRRQVANMLNGTGVTLVRIKIWPRTSPPAVEMVVATKTASAIFVRHRFMGLVGLQRPNYVRVVDARGSMTFEWGGAANEGFVGSAPALAGCIATLHWGPEVAPPPCPAE